MFPPLAALSMLPPKAPGPSGLASMVIAPSASTDTSPHRHRGAGDALARWQKRLTAPDPRSLCIGGRRLREVGLALGERRRCLACCEVGATLSQVGVALRLVIVGCRGDRRRHQSDRGRGQPGSCWER